MSANPLAVAARRSLLLFVWQMACVAVFATVGAIVVGVRVGGSILAGGGIGLAWTAYMAFTLYRHSLDYGARLSAASIFKGWLIKIVMTIGLLVVAFRSGRLAPPAVLGGLFVAMVAYWVWFAFDLQRRWSGARD
jgi:F0F1-type ATP synthase assembly protein I